LISQRSYIIIDLVKQLHKSTDVKRALNKGWGMSGRPGENGKMKGGAGSIFDDFLGGGDDSSSEEEEEKKEEIDIDDAKVLE
jgi:hypothetical protein